MAKTDTIHVRVNSQIKKQSEEILEDLGINLSYAISLFLKQVIIKQKIPFDIVRFDEKEQPDVEKLAIFINNTSGSEPDEESKKIIRLYSTKQIDYETACFAISRRYLK